MPRKKKIAPSKLEDASSAQLDQLLQQFSDDHHNYKEDVYYKKLDITIVLQ